MRRLGAILVLVFGMGLLVAGTAVAGQKEIAETAEVPPLTTQQIVLDCTISGVVFSAATTLGWFKPMTVALGSLPALAVLHEAVYGCGIGVISGYVSQTLVGLLPMPPPPDPFAAQSAALPATVVQR
jgi:hypothetical protein